jgi:hypothetical protein
MRELRKIRGRGERGGGRERGREREWGERGGEQSTTREYLQMTHEDIVIEHPSASRKHAAFVHHKGGKVYIIDLQSGTIFNLFIYLL